MKVSFNQLRLPSSGSVVIGLGYGEKFGKIGKALDKIANGLVSEALKFRKFKGKAGELLEVFVSSGSNLDKIVVFGLGSKENYSRKSLEEAGASLWAKLFQEELVSIILESDSVSKNSDSEIPALVASGLVLRSYNFHKYLTKQDSSKKVVLKKVLFSVSFPAKSRGLYRKLEHINNGVFLTRDLVNEPANILNPSQFARKVKGLSGNGLRVSVIGKAEMSRLGMNALLGVAKGSAQPPKTVIFEWNGGKKSQKKIAFVGKGVCFDSGGISIKPSQGMWDMKWDMGGAAVVAGLMKSLAERKTKANVIGIVGLVENMPDGAAQRPGDIVKSADGQTIEVLNTDAEGRLVLADILWYVQKRFKPSHIIDLATLTGAVVVALSKYYAGLFANDNELADQLISVGEDLGERLWRLPMGSEYDKLINSKIADMKNIGGRNAGAITAAQFLKRFVKNDVKWAHIDIAGVTWTDVDSKLHPSGATGYGVRLLNSFVEKYYEKNRI